MLRIYQCTSAEAAQSYYTQGLAREDYYSEGQEITGLWGGEASGLLGLGEPPLGPDVTRGAFARLTDNLHPSSGERLTLRQKEKRTVGYDMNFHAPKGVSLLHGLHDDDRIVDVFRSAVQETMRELEALTEARVRKGGVDGDRRTGNLAWGEFVHFTARPSKAFNGPDPHLHAHNFVFNATFDAVESCWKAGQFRSIVRDAPYFEAAFHTRFASGMREIGYHTERTATGWDVAGIPRSLVDKFSNRTHEIEAAAAHLGIKDPEQKAKMGARTRSAKDKWSDINDLRASWDERLTDDERDLMNRIAGGEGPAAPGDPSGGPNRSPPSRVARAVDWAIDHAFERQSSVRLPRLVAEALKAGVGEVTVEGVWKEVRSRDLVTREEGGDQLVTTRAVIEEERAIVDFAVEGRGTRAPIRERIRARHGEDWHLQDTRLNEDQQRAVAHLLDSTDRVMAVRGAAGVGKTTMMREAVDAMRAAGHSVVVVAPTTGASRGREGLRGKGFPGADTVAKLLTSPEMQRGLSNRSGGGILWVDEAGLLGARTMRELFDVAEKHNARVVLCGDERQHKPVERGDALRILEKMGGITSAELKTIRRQKGLYLEAVAAASDRNAGACVDALERLDAFHEIRDQDQRNQAIARDYVETLATGRSAVVVSPTHYEGQRIAGEIRNLQRDRGALKGEDRTFSQLRDLGWTEAERRDPVRYDAGMVASFHQHAKGVVAGDRCEILGPKVNEAGQQVVRARTPRGNEIDLPIDKADRFQVFEQHEIRLAVGDEIRVTRNGRSADQRGPRFNNGARHIVTGFTEHGAAILDGKGTNRVRRVMPKNFGHLTYGSVRTSHAAQGGDVDRVLIAMGAISFGGASEEQFYVSISRGKWSIGIYTDDKDALTEAIRHSSARTSGLELESEEPLPRRASRKKAMYARARAMRREKGRQQENGREQPKGSRDQTSTGRKKSKSRPSKSKGRKRPGRSGGMGDRERDR